MRDELILRRCFQLARLGAGNVSPNPMVGAVLVHEGKIIGEGWHQRWGEAHAEVNCLRAVSPENQALIPYSTLYCNLEPCFHFGKTPPCTDLILDHKIPSVVVSNTDPNPLVAGKGLAKLKSAGVKVSHGILEEDGLWLNRAFFTWISGQRPRVILKWAQTSDGFLGKKNERTAISSPAALRLVHRWRAECDAILVGTNTALLDDPRLDVRHYFGKNPLRIMLDSKGKIPSSHHLLDDSTETWVYGSISSTVQYSKTKFLQTTGKLLITSLLEDLKKANHAILLVEGGADVLNQFMETGYWDEIRVLENELHLAEGLRSPQIPAHAVLKEQFSVGADTVRIFTR
ncbi:MAG: bifunctional diaminohydroxyphosphoribosylaminopyrimidine deaminase/5-amino-6-(5-phosphoribosylamino)uracil reductase RibD [Saprospiraceae bacterium]|nr:bifunctional diaminohydroxyphosphoribosylaminopyrimidine deaminase/5-amino-6-(5-phosphoribosylamino)uracil reductase RibD [Saprospiraceae bacterium]